MATRKQRRRRAKSKRHDYEVVYLDDEGNEVEPEEVAPTKSAKAPARAATASKRSASTPSKSRWMREPQPPSWSRAARRGLLFTIVMVVILLVTNRQQTRIGLVAIAIVFIALIVPFGYYTDQFTWRGYQKRLAGKSGGKSAKR